MKPKRLNAVGILPFIALAIITVLVILPFLWMILLSFKNDTEIMTMPFSFPQALNFENYTRALKTLDLGTMFSNTAMVASGALLISVFFTFMSSYCIARMHFKHKNTGNFLYLFFIAGLTIPPYVMIFPVYRITIILGLINTRASLVLPLAATTIALDTLILVGFFRGIPEEMEEAAIIDGCGILKLCTKVIAPIAKPILATVIVFNIIYFWNEYPISSVLINKEQLNTVSLAVSMFKGRYSMDYSGLIAATIIIILPQIIFYIFFQKYIVSGMTSGAVKG